MLRVCCFTAILLLIGCDFSTPQPMRCREAGVWVEDSDTVTGMIVERSSPSNVNEVKYQCQRPFAIAHYGCTIALNPGEYRIVYLDKGFDARIHEECHALYEEWRHIE